MFGGNCGILMGLNTDFTLSDIRELMRKLGGFPGLLYSPQSCAGGFKKPFFPFPFSLFPSPFSLITFHFLLGSRVRLAPGTRDRRPQSSFSTQVLIGPARGLSSLSGFACTFFFLAWGIGDTRFFLFCPSAIESVSACSHKIYPFTTCCPNVPLCQVSGHLRLFLYY